MVWKVLFLSLTRRPMRYLPLVLATFLLVPSALAQDYAIDKGSYLLDGALSFSSQGGDGTGDRASSFTVSPAFAYFVSPGLALGGSLGFQRSSQGESSASLIRVGPNLSYYFGQPMSKTYPFVSAEVGYSRLSADFGDSSRSGSASGYQLGVSGGLSYMIARNVGLTGALFFQRETIDSDSADAFGFQGSVTAFIF